MKYLIVIEQTDTGHSAYAPDVPGCIATGKTRDEVEREMKGAIALHLTASRPGHGNSTTEQFPVLGRHSPVTDGRFEPAPSCEAERHAVLMSAGSFPTPRDPLAFPTRSREEMSRFGPSAGFRLISLS